MGSNGNGVLTDKQVRFVEEYPIDCNATRAAIRAGYSKKTANEQAARLLANVSIRAAIDSGLAKRTEAVEVTVERVLKEIVRMAWVDIGEAYDENGSLKPIHEIPEDVRRAIVAIEVDEIWEWEGSGEDRKRVQIGETKKVKFADKRGSNELLGKYLKMFVERHEFGLTDDLLQMLNEARQRVANAR